MTTDTDSVLLAHIQGRINSLKTQMTRPNAIVYTEENARLDELSLMLECLRAAVRLQQMANPEITFEGKGPE